MEGESPTQASFVGATPNPSARNEDFEELFTTQGGYYSNLMSEDNNNISLDEVNIVSEQQPSPAIPSARPNQKRSANFSQEEDTLVVSAWLNISLDPVNGTNQTRGTFWKRVYNYYHSNKTFESARSQSSISHRWGSILEAVNKFCSCISDIEGRRQSGVTLQDKIVQALALFKSRDKDKKSFQFMHCWNILRNQPKWHEKRKQLEDLKNFANKKQKTNRASTPATCTPICDDTMNCNPVNDKDVQSDDAAPKRPLGIKKAKEALRKGGSDSYMEASKHFWDKKKESDAEKEKKKEERFNLALEIEKERLQLDQVRAGTEQMRAANEARNLEVKESELQMKRILEEERIMTMDLSSMPEHLQQFYKSLQTEIIARRVSK